MSKPLPITAFDLPESAVRDRLDWAIRQGNQLWLWPEVDPKAWQGALRQIETVTRQVLTENHAHDPLAGNPHDVSVAAFTSGMGPLLGHWIRQDLLEAPEAVLAVLDLHYQHNSIRMKRLADEAIIAVECLGRHGVESTILKGMHTAFRYFPAPGTRPLADIDLLVSPAHKDIAGEVLSGLGYRPGRIIRFPPEQCWQKTSSPELPRSLSLLHSDDPWCIDLHTSLNRRHAAGARIITLDATNDPELMDQWSLSPSGKTFRPSALVLHLACHAGCGLGNLTMLRLTELALVIRQARQQEASLWIDFMALARRTGTRASAYPALALVELLAPGTVPGPVSRECRESVPVSVLRVIEPLRPASAQQRLRCSLRERFMWTESFSGCLRQLAHELLPIDIPIGERLRFYKARLWRALRGTLTIETGLGF